MAKKVTLLSAYENGFAYLKFDGTEYVRCVNQSPIIIREADHGDFHPMWDRLNRPNIFLTKGLEFVDFDETNNVLEASSFMSSFAREVLRGYIGEEEKSVFHRLIANYQREIKGMDLSYFNGIDRFEEFKPVLSLEPEKVFDFFKKLTSS